jgi:putative PEP-CTERM system TPR-repeat lipoprotein
MLSLADLARAAKDADGAADWLEKARTAQPTSIEPGLRMVDLQLNQKKLPQALATATTLDSSFPNNARVMQALAQAQLANGQRDQATATLKRVADQQPNSAAPQFVLGSRLAAMGNQDGALAAYGQAVSIDPHFFPAWREMAVAQAKANQVDKGLDVASRAAAVDPLMGLQVKAEVYAAANRFSEADEAFAGVLAKRQDDGVLARRAEVKVLAGDRAGARKILADWVVAHPEDDRLHLTYASTLLSDKDYAGAEREFEALLKRVPLNAIVLNDLAWLYGETNNPKAVEMARRAYAVAPESPNVTDTLGWLLAGKGDLKEAADLLASAHQRQPNDPSMAYHLATVLAKQGEREKAADLLKPILASGTTFDERPHAEALEKTLASGH